mgnify:CR=1 FL=1
MAEKKDGSKKTTTKKVEEKTQAQKAVKKQLKKGAKKALKNRSVQIALIFIVVAIIVALVVVYLVKPEIFSEIFNGKSNTSGENGSSNNNQELSYGEGDLLFHTINIGQGDCLLINFPDGKDMLIDCGSDAEGSYEMANSYISKYVTDGQLDYVMLTHSDKDHVG